MNLKIPTTDIADMVSTVLVPIIDDIIKLSRTHTLEELQEYLTELRTVASTPSIILSAIDEAYKEAKEELENKPQ